MIGKIIGAGLGAKAAEHTSKVGGPMGAVLGATAPMLLRRLSIPAMIALAAGGYAIKKLTDKKDGAKTDEKTSDAQSQPPSTSKAPAPA